MNNMYGLGTYGASSFVDTFFGTSSTSGGSLLSSIGDLQMIQKGAYKKAMKAYVAKLKILRRRLKIPVRQTVAQSCLV